MSAVFDTSVDESGAIDKLVMDYRPGYSLEQAFYTDTLIFERDKRRIFLKQWMFVDHESRIPNPGDYCLFEVAGESIIVVRDRTGEIHALSNVCRHRGSKICRELSGNRNQFVCPYHGWSYTLSGDLRAARRMPPDFDRLANGLRRFPLRLLEGLIFIRLNCGEGIDFDNIADNVGAYFSLHGLKRARVAERRTYQTNANWKLVVENYLECYHCLTAHPEYCLVESKPGRSSDGSPQGIKAFEDQYHKWLNQNVSPSELNIGFTQTLPISKALYTTQFQGGYRAPLREGFLTASQDGRPLAPLMGDFREFDGGETAVGIGPFFFMLACNDHAVLFRFTPRSVRSTDMVITWLVDGDAAEGHDYDLERLTWLWHRTTLEDKELVENNQTGVESTWYTPGMYSELEVDAMHFSRWYTAMIGPVEALSKLSVENPGLYLRFSPSSE